MESWKSIQLNEQAELLRKEWFSYRIESDLYDIELFETQQGHYYAIGTPADKSRLFIYGSAVVSAPFPALQQVIRKIDREHLNLEIRDVGEDNHPDAGGD